MNDITIILWITIALIAIIAIIIVKLHYKGDELEKDEGSILPSTESISKALNTGKNTIDSISSNKNENPSRERRSLSPSTSQQSTGAIFARTTETSPKNDVYIVPEVEVENNNLKSFEYESQNQILINYDNNVEKFQEPIKQSQMDIMTQNNKDTTELKDLFTIDELIKESKRKDSEREKESQKINKDEEDAELRQIKESIKNKTEEPLIEEVINDEKEEKISETIKEEETPSLASQKDIDDAISTASKESEEKMESIAEEKDITNVLLDQENKEEISEPTLKTPSKVGENKDYKLGASIDDADLFGEEKEEEADTMDLDYRKDIDKFTRKIKGSKIFQEVKDKLSPETEEIPEMDEPQESYIRNVNEYDEYEPIINETHLDVEASYDELHDLDYTQKLREENTRRVFNMAKNSPEVEPAQADIGSIRSKPARDNIKITLNNNEVVLKKGDEIIYNHLGETYSSQVYAINGDDISVRYRRKDITIKPSDVKKIY